MTIACVLKLGGHYTREWVYALKRGINRHAETVLHNDLDGSEFVCLTDDPGVTPLWRVPLKHGWPGWWSKLELFRPGLFKGPVLYLDLDTLVVGDLTDLCSYTGDFAMLSDFYRPKVAQSGVMLWTPGPHTEFMYREFVAGWYDNPGGHRKPKYRGDGEWIHAHFQRTGVITADRIQALYPGQVVSLKVHAREGPPDGARLVCGHGNPRFDNPKAGWAHTYWRG